MGNILTSILTSGLGGGGNVQEFSPTPSGKSSTDWTFIAILFIALAVIGGTAYYLMSQRGK